MGCQLRHKAGITARVPKAMTSGARFVGRFNSDAFSVFVQSIAGRPVRVFWKLCQPPRPEV